MKIARSWYGSFDIQNSEESVRSLHTAATVSISGRVHAVFAFRLRYCDAVPFFQNTSSIEKVLKNSVFASRVYVKQIAAIGLHC